LLSARRAQREFAAGIAEAAYVGYALLYKKKKDPRPVWKRLLRPDRRLRQERKALKSSQEEVLEFYWWLLILMAREGNELPSWEGIRIVRE
jgi:hypothetical protein